MSPEERAARIVSSRGSDSFEWLRRIADEIRSAVEVETRGLEARVEELTRTLRDLESSRGFWERRACELAGAQ